MGAGGRYNGLVSELGGPDLAGIGFGSGVERILLAAASHEASTTLDVFFVTLAPEARVLAMKLANALRSEGVASDLDYAGRSAKPVQAGRPLRRRSRGYHRREELQQGVSTVRDMRSGKNGPFR